MTIPTQPDDLEAEVRASEVPCRRCGGVVREFTVPNEVWNAVIRVDGRERDDEYICLACWYVAVLTALRKQRERIGQQAQAMIDLYLEAAGVAQDVREGRNPLEAIASVKNAVVIHTELAVNYFNRITDLERQLTEAKAERDVLRKFGADWKVEAERRYVGWQEARRRVDELRKRLAHLQAALAKARAVLRTIALNYDLGQSFSGTDCAAIAKEALAATGDKEDT